MQTGACWRWGARLKDHAHGRRHLDDLAVGQAQLEVVVQDRVHALNPERVHRPIQEQPLAPAACMRRHCTERHAQHAILEATPPAPICKYIYSYAGSLSSALRRCACRSCAVTRPSSSRPACAAIARNATPSTPSWKPHHQPRSGNTYTAMPAPQVLLYTHMCLQGLRSHQAIQQQATAMKLASVCSILSPACL